MYFKAKKISKNLDQSPSQANDDQRTCEKNMGNKRKIAKFRESNQRIQINSNAPPQTSNQLKLIHGKLK